MNDRKVLVYEDDPSTIEQINSVLSALGVELVAGSDPAGILDTAREVKPDLIILSADIKHGFSACLKLKKDKTLKRLPLFMISGKTPPDVITKHQRLPTRADVYLTTPLSGVMLTEILREQLPALPPAETDQRPEPAGEIDVNEISDRTMVSNRSFEAAVVNFVEDEVRDLKSTVVRLQTEKQDLNGKIGDLESMLRNQSETLTSSLKAIRDHQDSMVQSSQTDQSALRDLNQLIDDAVAEAVKKATQQAEASARENREKLEGELADALARIDDLKDAADESTDLNKKIGRLEKQVEDAKTREKERKAKADRRVADLKAEAETTQELFGRLESGYKDTIAGLEEERDSLQDRLSEAENVIEELREKINGFKDMADQFPALQEAAARNEVLSVENRKLQRQVDRLEDRVDELEPFESEMEETRKKLQAAVEASETASEELADLKRKFKQVKKLLGVSILDVGAEEDDTSKEEDPT